MCSILLGACSWNYESWVGLVYSAKQSRAADYLPEYAQSYNTVEIDSWYYKIPTSAEAKRYNDLTPDNFVFTCKAVQDITVPFKRSFPPKPTLEPNPDFLSPDLFHRFGESIEPILSKTALIMLEFEYLNREKMESRKKFMERFGSFRAKIDRGYRIGVETRNKNYLTEDYFAFLKEMDVVHVFSEKQYMPPVYEVYNQYKSYLGGTVVIRLLGGDRTKMEEQTEGNWNRIVEEKKDKDRIARMSLDAKYSGKKVIINVNNHYEGSSPVTIGELSRLLHLFDNRGSPNGI